MAHVNWEVKAREFANCNCSYGCPCQFNGLPTYGNCEAVAFYVIDEGQFGATRLDGLRTAVAYWWPGPVHEGQGKCQIVIDERADQAQREALFAIMTGGETEPMATMWSVFSAMTDTMYDPIYAPIAFEVDVDERRASGQAEGFAEIKGEPILNPVTGLEHRARIDLPHGFEYELAEIGRGWSKSHGAVALDLNDSYGQFANIHLSNSGVVRAH